MIYLNKPLTVTFDREVRPIYGTGPDFGRIVSYETGQTPCSLHAEINIQYSEKDPLARKLSKILVEVAKATCPPGSYMEEHLECDDCDGSGTYLIDGQPQACICSEEQSEPQPNFQNMTLGEVAASLRNSAKSKSEKDRKSDERLASWLEELELMRKCVSNARLALAPISETT